MKVTSVNIFNLNNQQKFNNKNSILRVSQPINRDTVSFQGINDIAENIKYTNLYSKKSEQELKIIKDKIGEKALKEVDKSVDKILPHFGINVAKDENDKFTISGYRNLSKEFEFLGINEDDLFKNIKEISGGADFKGTKVQDLSALETIRGSAFFEKSLVKNASNLKTIGGNAYFGDSQVENLSHLTTIGGDANFGGTIVSDLSALKTIKGNADFSSCKRLRELPNLQSIGWNANFDYSNIQNIRELKQIGGIASFRETPIKKLENLETVGAIDLHFSEITDLGKLREISRFADFRKSKLENLGVVEKIGGWASFEGSKIRTLEHLKSIGDDANFSRSAVSDLGVLETIGGDADFSHCSSRINLGELKSIGGDAKFNFPIYLGKLKNIGGKATFYEREITFNPAMSIHETLNYIKKLEDAGNANFKDEIKQCATDFEHIMVK